MRMSLEPLARRAIRGKGGARYRTRLCWNERSVALEQDQGKKKTESTVGGGWTAAVRQIRIRVRLKVHITTLRVTCKPDSKKTYRSTGVMFFVGCRTPLTTVPVFSAVRTIGCSLPKGVSAH